LYQGRLKFLTRHYHPKKNNLPWLSGGILK
jgi:hypothetical protein